MKTRAANTLWARAFVDELARSGVRDVVVAPGSRSTPLVLAFVADGRFRMRVHLDERSAAFFALGVGKASGTPAAVVTTSGTATANLFPAVIEAAQAEVPLLVLTADRPHRLRDADANQAIDQVGLFGSYPRASFEVAPPELSDPALRHLRALACRAVAACVGAPRGPVHVNFPFDKPLEPGAVDADFVAEYPLAAAGRTDGEPFVRISTGRRRASDAALAALEKALASPRPVIVAGVTAEPERVGRACVTLAAASGAPLLADPLSGARYGPSHGAQVVAGYDLFLRDDAVRAALTPTAIVRVGASPTSTAVQGWLLHHQGVPHIVIDEAGRWKDHRAVATEYVDADPATTLLSVAGRMSRPIARPEWTDAWLRAQAAVTSALAAARTGDGHEGDVLAVTVERLPAGTALFVSSSMPVRDLDAFGLPREDPMPVFGNRGASGIDGIVSSAFGVASVTGDPTVCVIGDVAFFHDQNGLLWSREPDAQVVFVLIDNDGGGIFHLLPVAEHEPAFTEFFATPHGLDFRHAAAMHGIAFSDETLAELPDALANALAAGRTCVLRVRTDRAKNSSRRSEVVDSVVRGVRATLG